MSRFPLAKLHQEDHTALGFQHNQMLFIFQHEFADAHSFGLNQRFPSKE